MEVQVMIRIPKDILSAEAGNPARQVLEEFALGGYKSGQLTHAQVRRLLNFSTRMEVDGFLKEHDVPLEYSAEDLDRDLANSESARRKLQS